MNSLVRGTLLLLGLLQLAPALASANCQGLLEQRDQLAAKAMQAEVALIHSIRRRLCPRVEALAEQGHAQELDISAYIHCRQEAEAQLRRTRPALYHSGSRFICYTLEGAELARQADGVQASFQRACPRENR
jgi:hypothetical protein